MVRTSDDVHTSGVTTRRHGWASSKLRTCRRLLLSRSGPPVHIRALALRRTAIARDLDETALRRLALEV
jgi:hypothetical protein